MTQKYLNTNPIARRMSLETLRIFENESVDELMQKMSTSLFDIFKRVTVDFAPAKQRKMSTVKEKLKDTANSSSFKALVAKMKDYAKEADLDHSNFADVKDMYIDGMEQLADSIKRAIEIDPKLEDKVIKYFQSRTSKYAQALEQAYKEEKEENEELNESFHLGLRGRAQALKNRLRKVLIPESAGKTADDGYGRNWQRIFSELYQKLSSIDHRKEISNDKEKKAVKDLEAQTDKLSKEFYTYCVRATEAPFKKILSDDEISNKFLQGIKDTCLFKLTSSFGWVARQRPHIIKYGISVEIFFSKLDADNFNALRGKSRTLFLEAVWRGTGFLCALRDVVKLLDDFQDRGVHNSHLSGLEAVNKAFTCIVYKHLDTSSKQQCSPHGDVGLVNGLGFVRACSMKLIKV
jgi:hypothetical protein